MDSVHLSFQSYVHQVKRKRFVSWYPLWPRLMHNDLLQHPTVSQRQLPSPLNLIMSFRHFVIDKPWAWILDSSYNRHHQQQGRYWRETHTIANVWRPWRHKMTTTSDILLQRKKIQKTIQWTWPLLPKTVQHILDIPGVDCTKGGFDFGTDFTGNIGFLWLSSHIVLECRNSIFRRSTTSTDVVFILFIWSWFVIQCWSSRFSPCLWFLC